MSELAKVRRSKGFSQRALAEEAGVSPSSVYEIEVGRRRANPSTLRKIADALGVEVVDLLEEEERPKASAQPKSRTEALAALLREHGIEVNGSELVVLEQYVEIHENPPRGIHVIANVRKEGEPVDDERVRGILLYLIAKGLLPEAETEAVAENMRRELAGTSA